MALRPSDEEEATTTTPEQLQSILRAAKDITMTSLNGDGMSGDGAAALEECQRNAYQHHEQQQHHHQQQQQQQQTEYHHQQQVSSSLALLSAEIHKVLPMVNRVKQGGTTGKQMAEMVEVLAQLMLMAVEVMKMVTPQVRLNLEDTSPLALALTPQVTVSPGAFVKDDDLSPGHLVLSGGNFTSNYASPGNMTSPDATTSKDDSGKKKRKRTKFTDDQRSKLEALATRAKWVLANLTKEDQEQAAEDIGIKVDSLKYWFHNTKQKGRKKQGTDEAARA